MYKKNKEATFLVVSIIMLVIVGAAFLIVLSNHLQTTRQASLQHQQTQEVIERPVQDSIIKGTVLDNLKSCLDGVDKWYRDKSRGEHANEYWSRLDTMRQQEMHECELRYK